MFKDIYWFEIKSWIDSPAFYIYSMIIVAASILLFASNAGVFDESTATVTSLKFLNSPRGILEFTMGMGIMLFLLFPNIVGKSIAKDYDHNVHHVMFSYPFSKTAYFFGKYLSAITICFFFTLLIALSMVIGMNLPGVNQELIGPHSVMPYVINYLVYMIPGVFLFGSIVFAVVTYTRSVVMGFVVMIGLYILQSVLESSLSGVDYEKLATMIDPFGITASSYYTKYWTISEENYNSIPLTGFVIWNRLLWTAIGVLIFAWSYMKFQFHVEAPSFSLFKRKKQNLQSVDHQASQLRMITLPEANRSFGIKQKIQSALALSKIDLKYAVTSGPFIVIIIIGLLLVTIMIAFGDVVMQTKTLPTTSKMLMTPSFLFRLFISLLTYVYVGILINRNKKNNIFQLEDVTPTYNISFMASKCLSVTLMQGLLLLIPLIGGIAYQLSQGFTDIELGVYLYDLFIVRWLQFIPWTLFAILIYTLIPNYYIGLVVMLVISIGMTFIGNLGIEQDLFKFNSGTFTSYSDISGYGRSLLSYMYYRLYWIMGGAFLTGLASWIWRRGMPTSFLNRLKLIPSKFSFGKLSFLILSLVAFISMGAFIYHETNVEYPFYGTKEWEKLRVDYEKNYKHFELLGQPRIIDVYIDAELYTKKGNFYANGRYILQNKTNDPIDTLVVNDASYLREIKFAETHDLVLEDTINHIRAYALNSPLAAGDSMQLDFVIKNKENNPFIQEIMIRENGTFINNSIFPTIGYLNNKELTDKKTRKKYDLDPRERMAEQDDLKARGNTYLSNCADWINFEIKIGTAADQIAMAPGNLVSEELKNGRKYFHYKMNQKMLNFYNISSARYKVKKDKWNDVSLSIYYHEGHEYNLDRMMLGLKDGLAYFTEEFSPYQHNQVRILEFPRAAFAQSFANTIPFSENMGFISDVDDSEEGGVDFPYAVTAHELAHQWWAHQVIGADTKGATMLSESLSEYGSLKVLEKRYGGDKMRKFLKDALDKYLLNRSLERSKELPLAYNENQQYIHYQKGSLVFYALSDLIGEKKLNGILSNYIESVAFQEPPYTVAMDLVNMIKSNTPDSLHYFIEDNFEHITLYDNSVTKADYTKNKDGSYTIDLTAQVTKYRTGEKGKQQFKNIFGDSLAVYKEGRKKPIQSLPLQDYIDVGVFGTEELDGKAKEKLLYLKKHKISSIENQLTITVNELPKEVGIDPYNKLIDRNSEDNKRSVKEKE